MMITIHGLPPRTNFQALKTLVKQQCNIVDFILDNLVDDGPNSKKVRIGLSDDSEGYRIMKCLDGFRMSPTHVLKIVPVGKQLNPPQQSYNQKPGFQNDYPNQPRSDYHNQPMNDYGNRGPQGPMDRNSGPNIESRYVPPGQRHLDTHGPGPRNSGQIAASRPGPFQRPGAIGHLGTNVPDSRGPVNPGPSNPINSEQWGPNMNPSNQWTPQGGHKANNYNQGPSGPQAGFGQQHPQGSDQYGPGRQMDHRYGSGFPPKTNEMENPVQPGRRNALRMVDIVDTQVAPRQDKPIIIMKDNFQGPSNFITGGQPQHGHFEKGQGEGPHWQKPQQSKPFDDRRHPPIEKRTDIPKQMDYDKRGHFSPPRNARLSPGRRSPPRDGPINTRSYQDAGRTYPTDRRVSPTSRLGPPVREFSPSGRRISPPTRRISPPGRGISPPGRRISPFGRRDSPTGRKVSPGRRISPSGRRNSPPGRKLSSPVRRMSPGRRDERRMSPNDRKMGRRESPRRYSPKRASPVRPHRFSPSRLGDKPADKFVDDKVPKSVRPAYEPSQAQNQSYSGGYRPNLHENVQYPVRQQPRISPWQTDKAYPGNVKSDEDRRDMARREDKDMFPRRPSRSPARRSRSPLKDRFRRSPSLRSSRSPRRSWALEKRSPEPARSPPPPPVWPGQDTDDKRQRFDEPKQPVWDRLGRGDDDRRAIEEKLRLRTDLQAKFDRREADERRDFRDDDRKRPDRDRDRDFQGRPDFPRRDSPRRDDKVFSDIDKDFQEIYKRAVEFRKKTEERKSGERRREEFEEAEPYRPESPPRRNRSRDGPEWNVKDRKRIYLPHPVKAKRDKAIDEITEKMLSKYEIRSEHAFRVAEEVKLAVSNVLMDMFADKDVSFIELVIKYNARYDEKEEAKLMQDVLSRLPSQYRGLKRKPDGENKSISAASHKRGIGGVAMKRKYAVDDRPGPEMKRKALRQVGKKPAQVLGGVYAKPVKKTVAQKPEATRKLTQKTITGVTQKKAAEKQIVLSPSVEPPMQGHYELSPFMNKMLEAELQDIMIKVWQSLPDDAPNDAEKLVAEKYRNKAGDALRNVIGLNISERLLNVHNTLYVKISFSGKPSSVDLNNFIKKYNISSLKRVGAGTFAVRMRSFQDFDEICSSKDLKCGDRIRVTATPCVQFLACPPNLRTCYDGKGYVNNEKSLGNNKPPQNSGQEEKTAKKIVTVKSEANDIKTIEKANVVVQKPAPANQNVASKVTPNNQSVAAKEVTKGTPQGNSANSAAKVVPKTIPAKPKAPTNKQTPAKSAPVKNEMQKDDAAQVTQGKPHPAPTETQNAVSKEASTVAVNSQNAAQKANPANIAAPAKSIAANAATANQTTVKQSPTSTQSNQTVAKTTPAKLETNNQNAAIKATPAKPVSNQTAVAKTTPAKPAAIQQNAVAKTTPPKPAIPNQNVTKSTPAKPAINQNLTKPAATNQNVTKTTPTKPAAANPKVAAKMNPTANKINPTTPKVAPKPALKGKLVKSPMKQPPKKKGESDFDELDDHDILAMISEGIVLDECSGSDED